MQIEQIYFFVALPTLIANALALSVVAFLVAHRLAEYVMVTVPLWMKVIIVVVLVLMGYVQFGMRRTDDVRPSVRPALRQPAPKATPSATPTPRPRLLDRIRPGEDEEQSFVPAPETSEENEGGALHADA